jgi:hypothetical protein
MTCRVPGCVDVTFLAITLRVLDILASNRNASSKVARLSPVDVATGAVVVPIPKRLRISTPTFGKDRSSQLFSEATHLPSGCWVPGAGSVGMLPIEVGRANRVDASEGYAARTWARLGVAEATLNVFCTRRSYCLLDE